MLPMNPKTLNKINGAFDKMRLAIDNYLALCSKYGDRVKKIETVTYLDGTHQRTSVFSRKPTTPTKQ